MGEGPHTSECTSMPSTSASGALCSFQISLQVTLAYSHASQVIVVPSLTNLIPSIMPLLTIFWMASGVMCARHLCSVTRSTHSFRVTATYMHSAFYRPFLLAWMAPIGFLALLKMWQTSALNTTLHPVRVIRLTDTIVIPMSGACRTSLRMIGVEDLPLGTLILRSPVPTA